MSERKPPEVFISHARQDRSYADLLKGFLLARDHHVRADSDIGAGEDWADAITQALEESEIVLLLLSPRYLESKSALYEAGLALSKLRDKKAKVIGILIGGDVPASMFPLQRLTLIDARTLDPKDMLTKVDKLLTH